MDNSQRKRFDKIFCDRFYLLDVKKTNTNYELSICGSTRNVYKVNLNLITKKIKCDCPDSNSWCRTLNCICKHSCFVLYRVCNFNLNNNAYFFQDLTLSEEDLLLILEKVGDIYLRFNNTEFEDSNENQGGIVDKKLIEKFKNLNFESLQDLQDENPKNKFSVDKNKVVESNNLCSICYEDLIDLDNKDDNCIEEKSSYEEIVKCPDCRNIFHQECVKKWLNIGNSTCVYCRSHVWRDFNNNNDEGEQNYINLS